MTKAVVPFSIEQLQFLQTHYRINPIEDCVVLEDGIVHKDSRVWLRGEDGPEQIKAFSVWNQLKKNPENFRVNKPKVKVEYLD